MGYGRPKELAGVYKFTCTVTNKVYIGSSIELKTRRWNHLVDLKKNRHSNTYFQRAWNKYGEESFEYEVLEYVDIIGLTKEEAIKKVQAKEQEYLDKYKSYNRDKGYNIDKKAGGGKEGFTYQDLLDGKCVYTLEQFNEAIRLLTTTDLALRKIAKQTGITYSMIKCFYYKEIFIEYLKDIKFVDRTKTKGMDNILNSKENRELFIKMFNEGSLYKDMCKIFNISEDTLKKVLKELGLKERERGYKVFQYNKYGEKINTFKDRNSVIKEFGDIDLSTSKKRRFSKGYFWSKEELKFNSLEKIYGKFIVCEKTVIFSYNKDGFYKIFKDVREASNELGFSKFLIRESLKNGREAKGYIFKNINKIPEEEINKILELKINNKESV